ncbi:hypothetical protein RBI22_15260 [Alcaligenaceae bacterium C4P045]|nr:hypothetical protein [Alcaligenaceae bacterium C4P045]
MQLVNATNPPAQPHAQPAAMPTPWAARLVERLQALYGKKFTDQWGAIKPERLIEIWAEELGGYTAEEIQRALTACRGRIFAPTLPEFLMLARPSLNTEAAYHEAVTGCAARANGEMGNWSHPAVYWAAQRVTSYDLLNNGWQVVKGRWEAALRDIMAQGRWEAIPAPALALTAPERTPPSREEAQAFIRQIKDQLGMTPFNPDQDPKAWAHKIIKRANEGKTVSAASLSAAMAALEVTA